MKIKQFIPANIPGRIILGAKNNGGLDDRDNPMYAGLDDEGFAKKRDAYKAECELERSIQENDDSQPPIAYDDLPGPRYIDRECDEYGFFFCRIFDDDDNLVGYYMISPSIMPGRVNKSFAFADEVDDDSDEDRIMFTLLNRLSECVARTVDVKKKFGDSLKKLAPYLVPVEFDWKSARFASHGQRPKKAGYQVEASEFDKFIIEGVENDCKTMQFLQDEYGQEMADEFMTRTIQCPEGIKLE